MISQTCEYALRAVVWLAAHPDKPQPTDSIAEATRVPPSYLAKTLQMLGKAGIVGSSPGPRGGFRLQRSATELTVLDVINAIDPIERITECPLGISRHAGHLCPLHYRLDAARALIEDAFRSCTIHQLVEGGDDNLPLCLRTEERP